MDKIINIFSPINLFVVVIIAATLLELKWRLEKIKSKKKPIDNKYTAFEVIDNLEYKYPETLSLDQIEDRLGIKKEDIDGSGIYINCVGEIFRLVVKEGN